MSLPLYFFSKQDTTVLHSLNFKISLFEPRSYYRATNRNCLYQTLTSICLSDFSCMRTVLFTKCVSDVNGKHPI